MTPPSAALLDRHQMPSPRGQLVVGHIESLDAWDALQPLWEAVHLRTPCASVFQSFPYLRAWWDQLGSQGRLMIIVVLQEEIPVAIAPLQITSVKQLGKPIPTVSFIGQPSESDRPTLLGEPDEFVVEAIIDQIFRLRDAWMSIVLFEQPVDSLLVRALAKRLITERYRMAEIPGNQCPYVDVAGSWSSYLSTRTKAFRKSLKRRRNQIEALGRVELELLDETHAEAALLRYRDVEQRSWKPAQNLGIASSARHWSFYQDLTRREGPAEWLRFAFLRLNGQDIAATFGLLWQRKLYSLHVAHDAAQTETSPGVVLTALELERCFELASCDRYEFLGGFLSNKRGWASGTQQTTALFGDRPGPRSWLFHLTYFKLKPWSRHVLQRIGALDYVTRKLHAYLKKRKPRADE